MLPCRSSLRLASKRRASLPTDRAVFHLLRSNEVRAGASKDLAPGPNFRG